MQHPTTATVTPAQFTVAPTSQPATPLLPALTITHPAHWLIDNALANNGATYELWHDDPVSTGTITITPLDLDDGRARWSVRVGMEHNQGGSTWRSLSGEDIQFADSRLTTSRAMLARLFPADVLQDAITLWLENLPLEEETPETPELTLEQQQIQLARRICQRIWPDREGPWGGELSDDHVLRLVTSRNTLSSYFTDEEKQALEALHLRSFRPTMLDVACSYGRQDEQRRKNNGAYMRRHNALPHAELNANHS